MKFDKALYETSKAKQLITCECNYCNTTFNREKIRIYVSLKRKQTELFCSKDCSYKYRSKKYDYEVNCKTCGLKVDYPKEFCNRSCAAKFTNRGAVRVKGIKKEVKCLSCSVHVKVSQYAAAGSFFCESCKLARKPKAKEKALKIKKCSVCDEPFEYTRASRRTCSEQCLKKAISDAGKKSSVSQGRRSKNEIYFYDLCKQKFSNIKHNEAIFNGWDADIILLDIAVAVLWNGPWHYKKITQKHSLNQVQNRDRLKIKEIENCGFKPYIIKDMGKFNSSKVENEFNIFCKWLNEKGFAGVGIEPNVSIMDCGI